MLLISAEVATAGPWVHEAGSAYGQLTAAWSGASQIFDPEGTPRPQTDPAYLGYLSPVFSEGRADVAGISAYGELGLGRGLEVAAALPLQAAWTRWAFARGSSEDIVQRNLGLGDLRTWIRAGRTGGARAASLGLGASLPLYDNRLEKLNIEPGNSDFYDDRVPLGAGVIALEVVGAVGVSLPWAGGWIQEETAFRGRFQGYSESVPLRLQVGFAPRPITGWLAADAEFSLRNGPAPDSFRDAWGKGPLAIDGQDHLSGEFGGAVAVSESWSAMATLSHTFWGRSFPVASRLAAGVTYQGGPK